MGESMVTAVVTIAMGIIGVAIIATLVSKNANTAGVISAGGSAFTSGLATALTPVTGGGFGGFTGGSANAF